MDRAGLGESAEAPTKSLPPTAFGDLLDEIRPAMSPVTLHSGDVLFEQGDEGDSLYVIVAGRLAVHQRSHQDDDTASAHGRAFLGRGALVGEMALLTDAPRTATVVALRDSHLLRLDRQAFTDLVGMHPEVALSLSKVVIERLQKDRVLLPRSRRAGPATVSVLRTTATGAPTADRGAMTEVIDALAAVDTATRVVTAADVEGLGPAEALHELDQLEASHHLLVYDTEGSAEWRARCVRQSDTALLVADAGSRPEPLDLDQGPSGFVHVELAVVNLPGTQVPHDAGRWLDATNAERHHQVVRGDSRTLGRMARLVAGNGVGIVFSGGGGRGFAHVGAWRAIVESGLDVDAVVGVSIGSLIGAGVAVDRAPDELLNQLFDQLVRRKRLWDVTPPVTSLFRGARIRDRLERAADGRTFETAWRPFTCYSANLSTGALHAHRRGSLWKAVRASMSLPGLLPPCPDGEDVLVDGSVLDNLPVGEIREQHPGVAVIGVDVGQQGTLVAGALPEDGALSGWRVLVDLFTPKRAARRVPSVSQVMLRVVDLAGTGEAEPPDLLIRPDASDFSLLGFREMKQVEEIGYRATMDALASWSPPTLGGM